MIARGGDDNVPDDSAKHYAALDVLGREICTYTAAIFRPDLPRKRADLLASLIEEETSLGETLYQIAPRVEHQSFSAVGGELVNATLHPAAEAMRTVTPREKEGPPFPEAAVRLPALQALARSP